LLLENETTAPPAGAFAVRVTVADDADPPSTLAGLRLTVSSVAVGAGGAGAVTVRVAVRVRPLRAAEITDVVSEPTALVATEVVAEVAPAGTVTLAATVAAAVLLLVKDTTAPPDGAGAVSVTVAVLEAPPWTDDGLRPIELSAAAVTVHPESLALVGVAEPSFTSTVQSAGGV
jgi:hypothetical protein